MNFYETLYIVHPALETGRLKDTIENVQKQIEKNDNNSTLCTEFWGKKRLSYPIEKQKYGTYVLVQYSGDGQQIGTFNVEMEHNPNILAHMTVKIQENEIREQAEDIDSQILGSEKENTPGEPEQEEKHETVTEEIPSNIIDENVMEEPEAISEEESIPELKIVEVPDHSEDGKNKDEESSESESDAPEEETTQAEDTEV